MIENLYIIPSLEQLANEIQVGSQGDCAMLGNLA